MSEPKPKLVLAYSGGLDTAIILHWLASRGYEVIAYTADLGQHEDFDRLRADAMASGACKVIVDDAKDEFIRDFVFPLLRANAIYEGRYLLGTPAARPLTARRQVEAARHEGASHLAHGATGKGNDQLRFELVYRAFAPDLAIVAPWRDPGFLSTFAGRPAALDYAERHGIPVKQTVDSSWSIDENLMHTSYEGGDLERIDQRPLEAMFQRTVSAQDAPDAETVLELCFRRGDLEVVRDLTEGTEAEGARPAYALLDAAAAANGIGRVDYIEDRAIGIKSRNVYETPAGAVVHTAHRDLELLTMDQEVMRIRDSLVPEFAALVYRGLWYSPEAVLLRTLFDATQEHVSGVVRIALYKGNMTIVSRSSPSALYDEGRASLDVIGSYSPTDASGYIRLHAIRLSESLQRDRRLAPPDAALTRPDELSTL
jgi:argininosuccinate synthase